MPDNAERGTEQSAFPFEKGDTVLIRIRERGDSGKIVAKFTARCTAIQDMVGPSSPVATFRYQTGGVCGLSARLRPYHAEYEVVERGNKDTDNRPENTDD